MGINRCQTLTAEISAATPAQAILNLFPTSTSCDSCQQRGGCQSLSLYQWFFAQNTLVIAQPQNSPYQCGEKLSLSFPASLLQRIVMWLLGLPFLGFLLGISASEIVGELAGFTLGAVLAGVTFYGVRRFKLPALLASIAIQRQR